MTLALQVNALPDTAATRTRASLLFDACISRPIAIRLLHCLWYCRPASPPYMPILSFRRKAPMPAYPRTIALLVLMLVSSPSLASGKAEPKPSLAPVVPGFARFYQDDKSKAAEGGHLLLSELHW